MTPTRRATLLALLPAVADLACLAVVEGHPAAAHFWMDVADRYLAELAATGGS